MAADRLDDCQGPSACSRSHEKRGDQALGRSRGGLGTKVHIACEGLGLPVRFLLTGGEVHDVTQASALIEGIPAEQVIADKGYDSEPLRQELRKRGIVPNAKYRKNHVTIPKGRPPKDKHEKRYCRQRWKVERNFAWLNNCDRLDRLLEESQKTYRAFMRVYFIRHYLRLLF